MPKIIIGFTDGEEVRYEGKDAPLVYESLMNAGHRGAEWTNPIILSNGFTAIFVLRNITRIAFKEEESK